MENILLGILDSTLDYAAVGRIVLIYLIALWGMFSFWVLVDAKKRYGNLVSGVIFFLLVFIFNFPALIFYIIIRPENEESIHAGYLGIEGGLEVPVAKFVDNNGNLEFSLNIKLNSNNVNPASVKVNIEGDKVILENTTQKVLKEDKLEVDETKKGRNLSQILKVKAKDISNKAVSKSKNLLNEIKSYSDKIEKSEENNSNDKDESNKAKETGKENNNKA